MDRSMVRAVIGSTLVFGLFAGGLSWLALSRNSRGLDFHDRLAAATEEARERAADVELSGAEAHYVNAQGRVELPISSELQDRTRLPDGPDEGIRFRFRSPSREAGLGAGGAALGRPIAAGAAPASCVITVETKAPGLRWAGDQLRVHEHGVAECGRSSPAPVKCTLAQVWAAAIKQGAPASALAEVKLGLDRGGSRVWTLEVFDWSKGPRELNAPLFSVTVPDNCE
jgi:hypothetical protein